MDNAYTPTQRHARRLYDAYRRAREMLIVFNGAWDHGKGGNVFLMEESLRQAWAELGKVVKETEDK